MLQKVITISQQKGGAGKTTIAAHAAVHLARQGYSVAALDIDPQQSLTSWFDIRVETLGEKKTGLSLTTSTDKKGLKTLIEDLRAEHDVVVIDSPPQVKGDAKTAIRVADLVIIPMQPSPADLWASTPTLEITLKENKNTFLLLNRLVPNTNLAKQFLRDLPSNRIISIIGNRTVFASSMAEGLTAQEVEPHGKAAEEVARLSQTIQRVLTDTLAGDIAPGAQATDAEEEKRASAPKKASKTTKAAKKATSASSKKSAKKKASSKQSQAQEDQKVKGQRTEKLRLNLSKKTA